MLTRPELAEKHAIWLEETRGISSEIAAQAGVVTLNNWPAFEYRRNGHLQYRKMRIETEHGKSFRRDRTGVQSCLFNEDCLTETSSPNAPLIITEGEIDALSWLTIGATHVVSVPDGAQLAKPGEGEIVVSSDTAFSYLWENGALKPGLQRFKKVIIATDGDEKGLILRDELAVRLGRGRCWFVTYPDGCKDSNEVLVQHGADGLWDVLENAKPFVPNKLVKFSDIPLRGDRAAYSSGWSGLDKHLMIVPPELIIVTGSPGAGKSQWTLAMCMNLARIHGLKGAILQFEDNPERNRRDLLKYANAWSSDPSAGVTPSAGAWVDRMFRTISPKEEEDGAVDFNLKWVQSVIEEAALRHDCRWVMIDPWNEIEHVFGTNETETTYTNQALRELKRLSRKLQIAVIIVAHPGKGANGKTINDLSLYDVSGSAAWKNKADHGIIVHRPDPDGLETLIKIDKSKDWAVMGRPGTVAMQFAPQRASFDFKGGR